MDDSNLTTAMTTPDTGQEAEELKEFEFSPITPSADLHEEEHLLFMRLGCR